MKPRKKFDQINVIPFIDIMLVLLVMVLTTATFIKQGVIPVNLPHASQKEKKDLNKQKEINIYVDKAGSLFFNKEKVTLAALQSRLSDLSRSRTIILRSDKDSKFQDFVNVMDILKKLNFQQLYIATKRND
jgi:biopolymer transport protein ExbD